MASPHTSQRTPPASAAADPVTEVEFHTFFGELIRGIRDLHTRHGPIGAVADGSQRIVFLFSPAYNQQVLSAPQTFHARFFLIRGPKVSAQRRLTCGLLAMNGERHRRIRRQVKEPFSLKAIASYGQTVAQLADDMLDQWEVGDVRNMAEEMRRFMLRVTSTLLFGFDQPERAYRLGDMLEVWVDMNHKLGSGALVPDEVFSAHYEDLLMFAEKLEEEILRMVRGCRQESEPGRHLLSILVHTRDQEGGLSDEELVGQAALLFAAAHMTTAHSLSWTLFLLAQHPSIMERLWQEVNSHAAVNGQAVAMENAGGSLLERVIKESMRILPASAYSQRVSMEAVRIGPLVLPRGSGIVFTPLVVHHLPEIYKDPERFDPDRWLSIHPSPYEYLPFGAGPRMCVGGPLAMAIFRTTLPRILRRYRLSVVPDAEITAQVEHTMLGPVTGIPMQIHPPDGRFARVDVTGNIHELVRMAGECRC